MKNLSLLMDKDLTVRECFQDYIENCSLKNLSKETIKIYQIQFSIFNQFLNNDNTLISEISSQNINDYILYLRRKNSCNDITINSYLRGVRAFIYYAMDLSYLQPFKIKMPKADKKIKETYTDEELSILLKKPNLKSATFTEYKVWVFSNYLLATGNRISSALSIKIIDIDFINGLIQVNKTKNRKAQYVPLSPTLASILKEYMKYRKGSDEDYLFCNTYGNKADIRTFQEMLAKYNRERGVQKTSAHLYRHTFAKKWILNGGDIFRLQKILGHSDLSVVKEYINMFGTDVSKDFDKFNPLDCMGIIQNKKKITIGA